VKNNQNSELLNPNRRVTFSNVSTIPSPVTFWDGLTGTGTFKTRPFFSQGLRFITPRGSAGRTPNLFTLDFHLGYMLRIGGPLSVNVFGDLFNVADAQRAVAVDEIWTFARADRTVDPNECGGPGTGTGTACPLGNPNWGAPLTFQDPRTLRLGIRLSW
jgi:hypothetical protein